LPTYETSPEFRYLYSRLIPDQKRAFRRAVKEFVTDLERGEGFGPGYASKASKAPPPGLFEMTWARDGRPVFSYGAAVREGEAQVIWHAVGTHAILP